jgi:transcriptional regulator GlxA family with amidase domain
LRARGFTLFAENTATFSEEFMDVNDAVVAFVVDDANQ